MNTARRARATRIHDARMSNTFSLVVDASEIRAADARATAERAAEDRRMKNARTAFDANVATHKNNGLDDLDAFFAAFDD